MFELEGSDGCLHEVNILPGQNSINPKLEIISCVVINITTHIRLSQGNVKDKYYTSFDKIVTEKSATGGFFYACISS